jgi:3-keto-L-gulonate-6-phosphate decarboxylase
VRDFRIEIDWATLYGADWAVMQGATPISTILAAGSAVAVYTGKRI